MKSGRIRRIADKGVNSLENSALVSQKPGKTRRIIGDVLIAPVVAFIICLSMEVNKLTMRRR